MRNLNFFRKIGRVKSNLLVYILSNEELIGLEMKYYLWYDEISKSFVVGKAKEFILPKSEILYTADRKDLTTCRRIARDLNRIA